MKIFVAIPGYDGKLHFRNVIALLAEQAIALRSGNEIKFALMEGNAGIVQGRNQLVHEFLETDFDRLVFLDSDITFEPGALIKLAMHPVNFVGGCYRFKKDPVRYPIAWKPDPDKKGLFADENGLIEVSGLPTGFLALSRNVFELIKQAHPERGLTYQCGFKCYAYFQMPMIDGHLYGEDFYFCREWAALGGKIYLDPEIKLTHWSFMPVPFEGHIGNWLKSGEAVKAAQEDRLKKELEIEAINFTDADQLVS